MTAARRRLPDERQSITGEFKIYGEFGAHKVFVTVGLHPDGTPGEVFARIDKWGSTTRGFLDAWCTLVSVALQHGVPLTWIVEKFSATRFEPSGRVQFSPRDGKWEDFGEVTSVLDLICRYLGRRFLK